MTDDTSDRNGSINPTTLLWVILALSLGTMVVVVVMSLAGSKDITTVLGFVAPILVSLLAMKAEMIRIETKKRAEIVQAEQAGKMDALHNQGNSRWAEIKAELAQAQAKIDSLQQQRVDDARTQGDSR